MDGRLSFVVKTRSGLQNVYWLHLSTPRALFVRAETAELHHPSTEPQDYELVEFLIRRIKLWLGLTKAKEVGRACGAEHFMDQIHEEHVCVDVSPHFLSLVVQA